MYAILTSLNAESSVVWLISTCHKKFKLETFVSDLCQFASNVNGFQYHTSLVL